MKKITLVVGETSSLPKEVIQKYQMVFVPFVISWDEGNKLPGKNIFEKMKKAEKLGIKTLPKTSQPSPFVFKKIFEEELKRSEKIICITISSKLSGAFNSAIQAREMVKEKERIFVLDSLNATVGEGLIDLKIAQMIKEGKNEKEILENFPKIVQDTHLFGMVEDPKWAEAGGRISHSLAALLSKMQNLGARPLLGIKDGKVKPVALKMKAKNIPLALFAQLKKEIKREKTERNKIKVAIGHADNEKGAQQIKDLIEENLKEIEILFLNLIDPVVGVHTGPGSLIVAWSKF